MNVLRRLRAMDAEEIRFRVACEARKAAGLLRTRLAPRKWRRGNLAQVLAPSTFDTPALLAAHRALSAGDFSAAHREFASYFSTREPLFVLDPRQLPGIASRIRLRFPHACSDATERADRILAGRYDLLGYEAIPFGTPPRWHADPVHGREAPNDYWSTIAYLDPGIGDHKIIWELNRHQHWLAVARAYHLTRDVRYYREFVEQLESWMETNPPLQGVNWASMLELGFRTISWTWALHLFAPAAREGTSEPPWIVDLLLGLDCQLQHIEDNLSRYFSPNTHLIGEGLALFVVSAALPELRASARRLDLGRRILLEELERQVHPDGGHVELSAHYHRYATDFYLLAFLSALATGDAASPQFEAGARRLAAYLRTITDDSGRLPLIGDDDGGQLFPICGRPPSDCRDTLAAAAAILGDRTLLVSDPPEEVFWSCGMLPLDNLAWTPEPWPSTALPQSGYYVSRNRRGDHLIVDAGRHGFLNGGHAHADALSLVLTVADRPLLVDSGTATYTMDDGLRDRFRTTRMHNTVVVNGRSQSEPRGPFHWRTTVDARALLWMSTPALDYVEGNHDGYSPVVHSRSVLAIHDFGWVIVDHLLGETDAVAEAFWHLHPDWRVQAGEPVMTLRHTTGWRLSIASSIPLDTLARDAGDGLDAYSPAYGLVERATCIRARSAGPLPRTFATFVSARDSAATGVDSEVEISSLPVTHPLPDGWHGAAFRLTALNRTVVVLAAVERTPRDTASGPGAVWGTPMARTDARVAVAHLDGMDRPILIQGTLLDQSLASSVHS